MDLRGRSLLKEADLTADEFLHCLHDRSTTIGQQLHAKHGLKALQATDEMFESPQSVVFDQAADRMQHTIMAPMIAAMGPAR